jgi:hypothetical protein
MVPPNTEDDEQSERRLTPRRSGDRQAWMQTLGGVLAAISIVGAVFSAGYSWRRVDEVAGRQDRTDAKVASIEQTGGGREVRVSVLEEQVKSLRLQLDRIEGKLDKALGR